MVIPPERLPCPKGNGENSTLLGNGLLPLSPYAILRPEYNQLNRLIVGTTMEVLLWTWR